MTTLTTKLISTIAVLTILFASFMFRGDDAATEIETAIKLFDRYQGLEAIETLAPLASEGNAKAMYLTAACYSQPGSKYMDLEKSMAWNEKAIPALRLKMESDPENTVAMYYLANSLYRSAETQAEAIGIFHKVFPELLEHAEDNDSSYFGRVANCYLFGLGTSADRQLAINWMTKAANNGSIGAAYSLSTIYGESKSKFKDAKLDAFWTQKAAEAGHSLAQYRYSVMLGNGIGVEKDPAKSLNWAKSAAMLGNGRAQFDLYVRFKNGTGVQKNLQTALDWLQKSAKSGDSSAQFQLSLRYLTGNGFESSMEKASEMAKLAAEQGHSNAQNILAGCYLMGHGVPLDEKLAATWFRKSADQGNSAAQVNLGDSYKMGRGVTKNKTLAAKWYLKAAENGDKSAENKLASLYSQTSANKPSSKTVARHQRKSVPRKVIQNPKSFAKKIAKNFGNNLMKAIGGGQDLVVNVVGLDYDKAIDEYEIDITVSFNGQIIRADNYQVAGRITIKSDGSNARFARTHANQNYRDWELLLGGAKLTEELIRAYHQSQKR